MGDRRNMIFEPLSTDQLMEIIKQMEIIPTWRNDPSYDWAQQVKDKRNQKLTTKESELKE